MAKFRLSAFADEAAVSLSDQLAALTEEGIDQLELRGVNGKNCAQLTLEDARAVRGALEAQGVTLSALGSPYGKAPIDQPFDEHRALFSHGLALCDALGCGRIRMFSFYLPADGHPERWRDEVLRRLEMMVTMAEKAGIMLVHENEKGIYGDTDARCAELLDAFDGRMGCVFDPANFIQCGVEPYGAFTLLEKRITYMHIKDALFADGSVVPAGEGDGRLPELLRRLDRSRDDEITLTLEPHLRVFNGLAELQGEALSNRRAYASGREAFHAACEALKKLLKQIEEEK